MSRTGKPTYRFVVDTGLAAFSKVASHYGRPIDAKELKHNLGIYGRLASQRDLVRAARSCHLRVNIAITTYTGPASLPRLPCVLVERNRFRFLSLIDGVLMASHPNDIKMGGETSEPVSFGTNLRLMQFVEDEAAYVDVNFDIYWFVRSLLRYRKTILEILVCSALSQLLGLATPMLTQVVIDRSLLNGSLATLNVITIALVVSVLFSGILRYIRVYAVVYTANRLDVELGAKLVRRLLRLPIDYFNERPTGQTVARVREIENVRSFLTGQALGSVLDAIFSLFYLIVMFFYSAKLTMVVVFFLPLLVATIILARPAIRVRLIERFKRGAFMQQYLVEAVLGAQTIKASAIEPLIANQWEMRLASYVTTAFRVKSLAAIAGNIVQAISQLTTVAVLVVGARLVIRQELTVGGLIAFNILTSQLMSPILRLSNLWQDVQQTKVSIDRIADIFNAEPEPAPAVGTGTIIRSISGHISLEDVHYTYKAAAKPALVGVNLEVLPGQLVAIVGASGSGKSTITKLVQRFYLCDRGRVSVDGVDLKDINVSSLRRSLGVVPQENILFNRSVHENIALTHPSISRDHVRSLAKLAGADDFINEMKHGYDTEITERGANLSGGQRQRIAIARALARAPGMIIFDEATSALDVETEAAIHNRIRTIAAGRTTIIITHRLATVTDCHKIFVLEAGQVVQAGRHSELLSDSCDSYRRLWATQS